MRNFISALTIAVLGTGTAASCGQAGSPPTAEAAGNAATAVEDRIYRGICDGSAAVMLDDRHFVTAYDEDNIIRVFPLAGGSEVEATRLDVGAHIGISKEFDLEGAARLGNRIYWIGSLGRNEEGDKAKPERRQLFATEIAATGDRLAFTGSASAAAGQALFEALLGASELSQFQLPAAARLGAKMPEGLNIEGLAATRDGRLIIAFRNPLIQSANAAEPRRALVVTLANPDAAAAGTEPPHFAEAGTIQLGGRGVRSIEFVPATGDYLIVAGAIDGTRNFALYRWTGRLADTPVQLPMDFGSLNPEGLAVLADGRLLILSDDGAEQIGGHDCKDEATPATQRSFRGRIVRIPQTG